MTTEDQIYASFMERADVRPGGEIFLHGGAAMEFVAACENAGIAILGIEGARLSSTEVVPYVDVIADFSPRTKMEWDAYRERPNRLALDFLGRAIEEKGADVSFCFELLDRAEYLDCLAKISAFHRGTMKYSIWPKTAPQKGGTHIQHLECSSHHKDQD